LLGYREYVGPEVGNDPSVGIVWQDGRNAVAGSMSEREQIHQLAEDLDRLIQRYRDEYDLTYASAVGVLNMKAFLLMREAQERDEED